MSESSRISSSRPAIVMTMAAKIEGMLFVSAEPVPLVQLAAALDVNSTVVERVLKELEETLADRGLRLQNHGGRVQLTTAPGIAALVEKFLGLEAITHLSRAATETLAIIAYQQPVTRPQVDSVRGVNSDAMLKSLLNKGLILETGRTDGPGRPILYTTSPEFLQHFGLGATDELPPLNLRTEAEGEHDELLKG